MSAARRLTQILAKTFTLVVWLVAGMAAAQGRTRIPPTDPLPALAGATKSGDAPGVPDVPVPPMPGRGRRMRPVRMSMSFTSRSGCTAA